MSVYVMDGHLHVACLRKLKGRHALYYNRELNPDLDEYATMHKLMGWVIGVKCVAHACSNGVKWGLRPHWSTETSKDAHLVISALRRSSRDIQKGVDLFLQRYVAFRPEDTDAESAAAFWTTLAVPDDFLGLFIAVDPMWDGSHLMVNPSLACDTNCFDMLSSIVAFSFKWVDWSDTRWVRVGECARRFVRSLAVGIDGAVRVCQDDDTTSNETLSSYSRSTPVVRKYLAVAATSACPVEAALLRLLKDDRTLRYVSKLKDDVSREMSRLGGTPISVWERMASLVWGRLRCRESPC